MFPSVEHAVKTHPFGTGQRRFLHIFRTLYERNVHIFYAPIATAVLEGREQNGISLSIDNLLYQWVHAVATVDEFSIAASFLNERYLNIL